MTERSSDPAGDRTDDHRRDPPNEHGDKRSHDGAPGRPAEGSDGGPAADGPGRHAGGNGSNDRRGSGGEGPAPIRTTDPILVDGVTKRFGTITALDDVSLRVDPNTVHCLLGPNGSGKTTLFDVLLDLTRPTSGRTDRGGATIGCGFQNATFYPDLTVAENLRTFAGMADGDEGWRRQVTDELGLDRVRERTAGDLSGGWGKRLDLALAVLSKPDYVILDEPLDDLDDVVRRRVLEFFRTYRQQGGALLVATHRAGAFEDVADHVTVLDAGEVVFDAPTAELDAPIRRTYLDRTG